MQKITTPKIIRSAAAVLLLLITAHAGYADSGRGRHEKLYVVPAPEEVTIDGDLGEWDLSGQIEMFVEEATRSTQNAKIAAMYDDEAVYVSGEVRDPTPMMNRHDPEVNADRAWDADAVQLRMVVDPEAPYPVQESKFKYQGEDAPKDTRDDIVHLQMWHFTDEGTANLQMELGMSYRLPHEQWTPDGLVPKDRFDGAYRKWDNERGYTFEYRLPWDTLGAETPPGAGDVVAGTVNVLWSRPDGLSTAGGDAWAYDIMRDPGFPWQSANTWGRLIFRKKGDVPRELVTENLPPERPLPLKFQYELPGDGETTIQLFDEDGKASRIIVPQEQRPGGVNTERWDGMDNYGEVDDHGGLLPAGKYRWRGLFSEDGVEAEYRFSVHNSGNPPYQTPDQTGGWGGDHGEPRTVAAREDMVFLSWNASEAGSGIIRTNLDGQKKWGSDRNAKFLATDGERIYRSNGGPVKMLDVDAPRPVGLPDGPRSLSPPDGGDEETNRVTGVEYHDGRVFVAYGQRDLVAVYNATDGALQATWSVPDPGRMAMRPGGQLAVISEGKVVSVDGGNTRPWLTNHLDEPVGIAVGEDGTAYVSNRGTLQNVTVFDADGNYRRNIGKEGGRPAMGTYDPQGMYEPGGVDLDRRGRLWVAETADAPKRVSVWDAKTGENVDEFFGASSYFAYGYIDPDRPREIYAHNVLWRIDWENETTEPMTTVWRATEPNMPPAPNVDAHSSGGGFRLVTAKNGRQIGWGGAGSSRNKLFYIRDGDVFRPFAGVINPWKDSHYFPALSDLKTRLEEKWKGNVPRHRQPRDLFWQDADGDARVSPDEVTPIDDVGKPVHLSPDLSVLLSSGHRLLPENIRENGEPVYDITQAEETAWVGEKMFDGYTIQGPDGAAYTLQHRDGPSLIRWTPDGEMDWYYSNLIAWRDALGLPTADAGRLWGMTRPMGVAGDYIAYQTYFGINHIFRRSDGMYVGSLLKAGGAAKPAYRGQNEGQGGAFVKLTIDGEERYFIIHGSHDVRVWEVKGLDTLKELPGGTYVHSEEKVKKARRAYREYKARSEGKEVIEIARGRDALSDAGAAGKELGDDREFKVRMAHDEKNLYVRYDVQSPHGLSNAIADPQRVFLGGNCLDLQFATNPDADPEREEPAPGDVRLLVTRQNGETLAVLYQPVVDGFDGEPVLFESPTGEERFDRIGVVEDVKLEYNKENGRFTADVTIPLDRLGLKLSSGDRVTMDAGYIFGNESGSEALDRAYLNNNGFSANVVDDLPHESRLKPGQWGTAIVK